MKTIKIETSSWADVQAGDRLSITRDRCNYLGITVDEKKGRLFVSEKSFGKPHNTELVYLDEVPKDWELHSIVREAPPEESKEEPKSNWKLLDLFKRTPPVVRPEVGSQEAIQEAIESANSIVNYFETRMQLGDPLFDQWMVDAYESAKEASEKLQKLLKIMKGEQ